MFRWLWYYIYLTSLRGRTKVLIQFGLPRSTAHCVSNRRTNDGTACAKRILFIWAVRDRGTLQLHSLSMTEVSCPHSTLEMDSE